MNYQNVLKTIKVLSNLILTSKINNSLIYRNKNKVEIIQ